MTAAESTAYLNKRAPIRVDNGLRIHVLIVDVKTAYGKTRFLVEPLEGAGRAWVEHVERHEQRKDA